MVFLERIHLVYVFKKYIIFFLFKRRLTVSFYIVNLSKFLRLNNKRGVDNMKIPSNILAAILLLTSANTLKAIGTLGKEAEQDHLYYGKVSSDRYDSLAKEAVQNQIYFSKHHKEDFAKRPRKRSHGKYKHKRKR